MLSGTDIDFAYPGAYPSSASYLEVSTNDSAGEYPPPPKVQSRTATVQSVSAPVVQQQQPIPKQTHVVDSKAAVSNAIYMPQLPPASQQAPAYYFQGQEDPSYVDKLMQKRRDLWKLLLYAFIILTALSVHTLAKQTIKFVIKQYDLSTRNTWLVRLAYPVIVVFFMWNIKAVALN